MTLLAEPMNNAIPLGCLIWTMDDESANALMNISQRHINLVKEYLNFPTQERKKEILAKIANLRIERETIIESHRQTMQ